jgi:hypothetical protein
MRNDHATGARAIDLGSAATAPPPPKPDAPLERLDWDSFEAELIRRIRAGQSSGQIRAWAATQPWTPTEGLDEYVAAVAKDYTGPIKARQGIDNGTLSLAEIGAFSRGAADMSTFNFADEISAATRALPATLDGIDAFNRAYRRNWLANDRQRAFDEAGNPAARLIGKGVGVVGSAATPGLLWFRGGNALARSGMTLSPWLTRAGLASGATATGGIVGGLAGTGEGSPDDRFGGTLDGTLWGAATGLASVPAQAAVRAVARPIIERIPQLKEGFNALARRAGHELGTRTRNFLARDARTTPVAVSEDDIVRFMAQGFNRKQAEYLALPYKGMGEHFFPRRFGLPESFSESRFNVLKPDGITRGDFYRLHYMVDSSYHGSPLPRAMGKGWSGKKLGLEKYDLPRKLWYGSPRPLKVVAGGNAAAVAGGGYWLLGDDE